MDGQQLKEAREAKGWTVEEVAAKVGTSYQAVWSWENKGVTPLRIFQRKLSEVFGVDFKFPARAA